MVNIRKSKFLFSSYIVSLGFYTLYNPGGIMPFCLIFAILIFLNLIFGFNTLSIIKIPKFSTIDFLLFSFLIISLFSVLININTKLNYNHLLTHVIVVFLYYYTIRIFLNSYKEFIFPSFIINVISYTFYIICITVILDQVFLFFSINIANYLPMESSNTLVGSGLLTRARGFFVEPTDLALGVNSIAPILLIKLFYKKNSFQFFFTLLLYLTILILTRSTAGFLELIFGIILSFFIYILSFLFKSNIKFMIKKRSLKIISYSIFFIFFLYLLLIEPILASLEEALKKLNFENLNSSDIRLSYWEETINMFYNSYNILTGYGTGYTTLNQKTFNWYLTVLVENGIFGFINIFILIIIVFFKIFNLSSPLKYGFIISISSVFLHLTSQTGFYYAFLWLLLVLIQYDWRNLSL